MVAGLLRLEFLTTYFSDQLVAGYTTGSAVHVIIGQVNEVLGIKIPKSTGPGYLFRVSNGYIFFYCKLLTSNWRLLQASVRLIQ